MFPNYEIKDPLSRTRRQTIAQGMKKNIYITNGARKSYLHNLQIGQFLVRYIESKNIKIQINRPIIA